MRKLTTRRKRVTKRFPQLMTDAVEMVAAFLGVNATEVHELALRKLFQDVSEGISSLMSGVGE